MIARNSSPVEISLEYYRVYTVIFVVSKELKGIQTQKDRTLPPFSIAPLYDRHHDNRIPANRISIPFQ